MLQFEKYDIVLLLGDIFDKLGIRGYLVGGAVRDILLERNPVDFDFVVELSAGKHRRYAERISQLLGCTLKYNDHYHTAKFLYKGIDIDFIMARDETYERVAARPRVWPAGLEKDLKRRDFTINSMAVSISGDRCREIIDPFSGRRDLEEGIIRILHDKSFYDDPTRIFRGIKYAARFGFEFERKTLKLMEEALENGVMKSLSPQRIKQELYGIFEEENLAGSLELFNTHKVIDYIAGARVWVNSKISSKNLHRENPKIIFPGIFYKNYDTVIKSLAGSLELGKSFEELCVRLRHLDEALTKSREELILFLFDNQNYISIDLLEMCFGENEEIRAFVQYSGRVKFTDEEIKQISSTQGNFNLEKARSLIRIIGSDK